MNDTIKSFGKAKVLVIGDVMIDHYIKGKVSRISPEAPVPVVQVLEEYERLGGAANVAANITSLGGNAVLVSVAGQDEGLKKLRGLLKDKGIVDRLVTIKKRRTTIKSRVLGHNQQLLRMDYEEDGGLDEETGQALLEKVKEVVSSDGINIVVLSDYAKGVLTGNVIEKLVTYCNEQGLKTVIDPKPKNIRHCRHCYLLTPNHVEASSYAGIPEENGEGITKIGVAIAAELESNVLVTRGEEGMALFRTGHEPLMIPTEAKQVFDVTGAGDTVTAVTALGLGAGGDLEESVRLANKAAGVVVGKAGTETLEKKDLNKVRRTR
ncbi:D-glycero-beta-D-manno-heptose-7-phosphate kinase [Candidatus Woesearchaeota archaeon]|nr:D-glycero-beta-D-manno-heptose-7-phosphate kinase [Candidatus Woesearchaeota archaeon]